MIRGLPGPYWTALGSKLAVVAQYFSGRSKGARILDLPAGNGLLAEALRAMVHTVVCGDIVISMPNVMNYYSRLHFQLTGTPYQFNPAAVPEIAPGAAADRGHVFPLSYLQLRYLFEQHGARVRRVLGDRYKKKALMSLYVGLLPLAWGASWGLFARGGDARYGARNDELLRHVFSGPLLFSRSLVLVLEKQ